MDICHQRLALVAVSISAPLAKRRIKPYLFRSMTFAMWRYLILLFLVYACQPAAGPQAPQQLRVEYAAHPMGLESAHPRFSWQVRDPRRGAVQAAYQVQVATSEAALQTEKDLIWDSGQQPSDQSLWVPYSGPALEPGTRYAWRVRSWDRQGQASPWSETGWWESGLLGATWPAPWIGASDSLDHALRDPADPKLPPSVRLRRSWEESQPVTAGRLYLSALGGYEATLNGQAVTQDLLTPGWTHYPKRIPYQVYDVTALLQTGPNALGLTLGNLWWSSGLGWEGDARYDDGPLRASAWLVRTYPDGQRDTLFSDDRWQAGPSPILSNSLYHGETFDARLDQAGWDQPGMEREADWTYAQRYPSPPGRMRDLPAPPIRVTDTLRPVSVREVAPDTFIFDLGQNMAGRARLRAAGPAGQRIQLRFAEILQPDGHLYTENLRRARATDVFVLAGNGEESWAPTFTYHGFRYVEVTGYPGKPDSSDLWGEVFHNAVPRTGDFATADSLLPRLHQMIDWGLRGNLHSVPTDCPQRDERLGWMGDAQAFAPTASYLRDMSGFWAKWMRDIADGQDSSGYVYDVNPPIVVSGPAKPGWGDAVVVVPWVSYCFYGDTAILAHNYTAMQAWVDYMTRKAGPDGLYVWQNAEGNWFGYGDWVAPEPTDGQLIGSAYQYRSTDLLARIAAILGREADAARYRAAAEAIAEAFQARYYEAESGWYTGHSQTGNLLPLAFGLTPRPDAPLVLRQVVGDVLERGIHPNTGFLGTPLLLPMLSRYGHHDLAYRLATQTTYPSWGYMAGQGATTIWELWNSDQTGPGMNSRNHFALGSVGEWYYSHLAGIRPDPAQPAFRHSILQPGALRELPSAGASLETLYGPLTCHWAWTETGLKVSVTIPANTSATLILPAENPLSCTMYEGDHPVMRGGKPADLPDYLAFQGVQQGVVILGVGAGTYEFEVKDTP
ncbi:MAG: alpha-L-rhamnosidase [Bacteroidetes bacterium]|nr:MAG: alpha-L-rhamnosidase [Bacteroidota bacterium]